MAVRKNVLVACLLLLAMAVAGTAPLARAEEEDDERESPPERRTREELNLEAAETRDRVPVGHRPSPHVGAGPTLTWVPLGPEPIDFDYWANGEAAGRVSAVVTDPRDAAIVYIAAAQGGVWKSTDGGGSWSVLTDDLSSIASGALALDPGNPDVVYYGTGEMHQSSDSYYGDGIFRSLDGGASWTKIATRASVGSYISRVAVHAVDPLKIFATTSLGFVRSIDGGATWSNTLSGDWCFDLALDPGDNDVLYAAMAGFGIYKSTNAGASWSILTGGLPTTGFDRINLAIAPSNPSVLYASLVTAAGSLAGMYRTADAGASWSPLLATPNYCGSQGWYDNCVIVDPSNPDIAYAGGMFPYGGGDTGVIRTADGGASWTDITFGVDGSRPHPDQHILAFDRDHVLWLGNDGGVWKTADAGAHWIDRNHGLSITQFYTVARHPEDAQRILGGTQDNGTVIFEGQPAWRQVIAGDGGYVFFRWNDPSFYYTTYVRLNPVYLWHDDAYAGSPTGPWSGDRASFLQGPLVQDLDVPNSVLAGTYRVYQSVDGGFSWGAPSADLTENGTSVLRALAPASGSSTIYSGSTTGRVFRTDDGVTWIPRHDNLPRKAINDIWVDPTAPMTAYLSSDTTDGGRVFSTVNGGATWTNISGDLPPNLRGQCLLVDFAALPPRLYLGTDYGLYSSANGGTNWVKEDLGLPNVAIFDLALDPGNGAVIAATHGRGMWLGGRTPLAVAGGVEAGTMLFAAAPNPAVPPVFLSYRLTEEARVSLEVFDLAGRRVRVVETGMREAGLHRVVWDGRDAGGARSPEGIYFYRLDVGARAESRRLALVR